MSKEPPKPLDLGLQGIPFRVIDPETGQAVLVTRGTPEGEAFLARVARHCELIQQRCGAAMSHLQSLARETPPTDIRERLYVVLGGKKK